VNVNDMREETSSALKYDGHFAQDVLMEESGVHVPIEIYEGCECTNDVVFVLPLFTFCIIFAILSGIVNRVRDWSRGRC